MYEYICIEIDTNKIYEYVHLIYEINHFEMVKSMKKYIGS